MFYPRGTLGEEFHVLPAGWGGIDGNSNAPGGKGGVVTWGRMFRTIQNDWYAPNRSEDSTPCNNATPPSVDLGSPVSAFSTCTANVGFIALG